MNINNYINKPLNFNINRASKGRKIYHYTGEDALLSILDTNKFWLTLSDDLDDPKEIILVEDIIEDIFHSKLRANNRFLQIVQSSKNYLTEGKDMLPEIYILSLSVEKDVRKLWEDYAKTNGYNIGLDYSDVRKIFSSLTSSKALVIEDGKVNYDYKEQKSIILNELLKANKYWEKSPSYIQDIFIKLFIKFSIYSVFFKRPAYKDEKEYRIIVSIGRDKETKMPIYPIPNMNNKRPKGNKIIKYIEVPLQYNKGSNAGMIPLIYLNRGPENTCQEEYINDYLLRKGYNSVIIKQIKNLK